MNKTNGYNGYYKGYEDEYGTITMSPWVEDLMESLEAIPDTKGIRERMINASYNQNDDKRAVEMALVGLMIECKDTVIYDLLKKCMASEREFLANN